MSNGAPRFTEHDTSLNLWLDDPKDPAVKATRDQLVDHLSARGFHIENDQSVDALIRDDYHTGNKGALEFNLNLCGRHLEIIFFQNVVRENRAGGEYDFDKREKMPFLIGMQYELERAKIATLMAGLGYALQVKVKRQGMAEITHRRDELAEQHRGIYDKQPESRNSTTATKDTVRDGDAIYFRNHDKRWFSGTAYYHINNMWWVLLPCGEVMNIASFELRHTAPEAGLKGQHFNDDDRKKKQMAAIHQAVARKNMRKIEVLRASLTPENSYYVLSLKHTNRTDAHITLWGQSGCGYRYSIAAAGKYSRDEIMAHLGHYNGGDNIAVDAETVERLVTMCDKTDRDLERQAPTLRNTPSNWHKLIASAIATPKHDVIPEVFRTKSGKKRKAA
ncbi:hypothetical protein [Glaciimonas sp. PCH181]|uniref:hypothetical protein n=1 Tax=Glaciimonas sp. PCH181 TaxID=2133943 RepID=UPI000D36B084|nr:hypothetical protein [Glaciimonas sp. PCH181]PUA17309.1 hypothetical protein C7W93_15390 [Glaciimonas sp. PCH181]